MTHTPDSLYTDIRTFLADYEIVSLWHFTDRHNVDSIRKYGILSLSNLIRRKILPKYGASSYRSKLKDVQEHLADYARLSFVQDHPLYHVAQHEGRMIDPVWIEIDLAVLRTPGIRACAQVASTNGAELFGLDELKTQIDFGTMCYHPEFYERKEARKAELLVPDRIAPEMILEIYDGQ